MGFSASFSMLHLDPILQELRHTRWASRKQTLTASNGLPDFFDLKEAFEFFFFLLNPWVLHQVLSKTFGP